MFRSRMTLFVLLAFLLMRGAVAREEIISFHSDIEVLPDSSMAVTERIRVRAEGEQIRRGIYREFPTDYRDRWNNQIQVGFVVEEVTRDGKSEAFFTEKYANGIRVYVGDANVFLSAGEYEYAISYRTTRQLGYFDDHDELYWNVTGNGWGFPISQASARIKLPAGVSQSALKIEGYTGAFGAKGQDYTAVADGDSRAMIATTRPLQPNEGLTVVLSWPKGVVVEPTAADRLGFLLEDNRGLIVALAGLLLMTAYLYYVWLRFGRDPEAGPVFPHYDPPENLSPGACSYILKMSHDNEAFSAAVLSLAVKGYINIHEGRSEALEAATGGTVYDKALDQLKPLQNGLLGPLLELAEKALEAAYDDAFVLEKNETVAGLARLGPGEKAVLTKLFATDKYLVLVNTNHQIISVAIHAHKSALEKYYKRLNFFTNGGLLFPAILIDGATAIYAVTTAALTPLTIVVLILALPVIVVFGYLMKAPTARGRKLMDRIEGFKIYLNIAEAQDLQRIEGIAGRSPVKTPVLFERYLPYAVAFDVTQQWADQFEALFTRIATEEGRSYQTSWYSGSKPIKSFSGFTASMAGSLGTAISSSSTAPGSSSGGSGGGSSGGGGGGGGGGGW